ncbi:MAG TPA: GNAT family N-acetyltransferase [Brevibacterium sp.]|nr:GNAT family N-acetyltransferase [Brevibacterium sp.]
MRGDILRSGPVTLRPPESGDITAIAEACQDPEIHRWTRVPVPYTRDDAAGFVSHVSDPGWESGTSCTWVIETTAPTHDHPRSAFAGMISLDGIGDGSAGIGFWSAPAHRGTGTMTAAGRLVLDVAFTAAPQGLGLARVEWRAYPGNSASAAVARRLGFAFEGTLRGSGLQRGRRVDEWVAGVLATDDRSQDRWAATPERT